MKGGERASSRMISAGFGRQLLAWSVERGRLGFTRQVQLAAGDALRALGLTSRLGEAKWWTWGGVTCGVEETSPCWPKQQAGADVAKPL